MNRRTTTPAACMSLVLALLLLPGMARAAFVFVPRHVVPGERVELVSENVDVAVENGVATVRIEDLFRNQGGRPGEGDLVMPLPEGTVLMQLSIFIDGREVKGEVLDRDAAARVYTDIVRQMRDPLLAEWAGRNLVRVRLFPVPARGEQRVRIEYATVLPVDHALTRFTYPLKGCGTDGSGGLRGPSLDLHVDLRADHEVRNVYSPTHEVEVDPRDSRHVEVRLKDRVVDPTRDFVLYYTASGDDVGFALLPHRKGGQEGTFLMTFQPRVDKDRRPAAHLVWVLDVSGSMSGPKLDAAKEALRFGLRRLHEDDAFNLVAFSTESDALFRGLVPGTAENVKKALQFVDDLEPEGGTDIDGALRLALDGLKEQGAVVVFLTDGEPTVGETRPERILKDVARANDRGARVFAFGVGDELNTFLLDRLAADNGGTATYVRPGEETELVVSNFFSKIAWPALSDLELSVDGVDVDKLVPKRLPVLFRGDALVVTGRYRDAGRATVRLTGTRDGRRETWELAAEFPERQPGNPFVPKLWATRRVAALLEEIRLNGSSRELVDEVTRLGQRYGLVTPYTSYLIKEQEKQLSSHPADPRPPVRRPVPRQPPRYGDALDATGSVGPSGGEKGLGGGGFGGGGSGGYGRLGHASNGPAPAMAAPARPAAEALADVAAFEARTGAGAVATSRSLGKLKAAQTLGDADEASVVTTETVGDRSFRLQSGAWVDDEAQGAASTVKVKYLSPLYFSILRELPELRSALSLGERVRVRVGSLVLEVGPEGATDEDEGLVARLRAAL